MPFDYGLDDTSINDADLAALQRLVAELRPSRVVEIGSHRGKSANAMLDAGAGEVWCIDPWPDEEHYAAFVKNTEGRAAYSVRATSMEAFASLSLLPFDMLFVDGDHSYEACLFDIRAWSPRILAGGIVCGHDFDPYWPGVIAAVCQTGDFCKTGRSLWWRKV